MVTLGDSDALHASLSTAQPHRTVFRSRADAPGRCKGALALEVRRGRSYWIPLLRRADAMQYPFVAIVRVALESSKAPCF